MSYFFYSLDKAHTPMLMRRTCVTKTILNFQNFIKILNYYLLQIYSPQMVLYAIKM